MNGYSRHIELGTAAVTGGCTRPAPHGADAFLQHHVGLGGRAVEMTQQDCRADGRMTGERQLATGSEDPERGAMRRIGRRKTNTVSDRLNSRAMLPIVATSSPSDASTTASGLPVNRVLVKTSSVANRRRMS